MGSQLPDAKREALTRRMKTVLARTMRARRRRKTKMSFADYEAMGLEVDYGKGPAAIALAAPGPHAMSALRARREAVAALVREGHADAALEDALVPGELPPEDEDALDPVALVKLACDRLAPAVTRSAIQGRPTIVRVPDEATAAVFRAALARTIDERPTDRLVEVLVEN